MIRNIISVVVRFFRRCSDVVAAVISGQHSEPDPGEQERKRAAKVVGDAMHSTRGNSGFSPFGASERVLGKELAEGHKPAREQD